MSLHALYSFFSHVYIHFGENANLRVRFEIAMFFAEINAYFAVKFCYKNQFVSLLWYLHIRVT